MAMASMGQDGELGATFTFDVVVELTGEVLRNTQRYTPGLAVFPFASSLNAPPESSEMVGVDNDEPYIATCT